MKKFWLFVFVAFVGFAFAPTFAKDWDIPGIDLITRAEWGADESIRFRENYPTSTTTTKPQTAEQKAAAEKATKESAERSAFMKKYFLNDWSYSSTKATLNGHTLLYPDQIQQHKTKIVIHHTATTYDTNWGEQEIKIALQQIYKYHTLNRDFGDIGYNFLIDHLGNIYEGRAGGAGAVGMHVSYNNVATLGIALLGNFGETQPTQAQINALTNLLTALAKMYQINPTAYESYFQLSTTAPYITAKTLPTIVGHGDIAATACPWKRLHQLLPLFRSEVANRLKGEVPKEIILYGGEVTANKDNAEDATTTLFTKLLKLKQSSPNLFQALITSARKTYQGTVPNATNLMNKLTYGYGLNEIKNLLSKEISVLLYELTTQYKTFDLQCEGTCSFSVDTKLYQWERATISIVPSLQRLEIKGADGTLTNATDISVQAPQDTLITITNYPRTSYAGIPRNTFRGSVTFKKELYQTVEGKVVNDFVVINQLPFMDYLKGVVETNDQESLEKNKVMALIAKNYALFYLEKKNLHPNIPASSSYSAIDSPEMFQKYVGAGAEKTLKKRGQAVETTKNQIVMYAGTLPILPYFSCSAGFTRTAKEKRGRQDTPYLNAAYDFSSCPTFEGHGVGLAGKGAEYLAQKGLTAAEILQRYYSGVVIAQL